MPILLGNMNKTSPAGNDFFLVKKRLPPIGSVQITSASGGGSPRTSRVISETLTNLTKLD
jgi:hypothetical protein